MPSRASRQFNDLTQGKNLASVPKRMRDDYQNSLVDAIGNPRDPMQIYDENGVSIGIKGKTGITELPTFNAIQHTPPSREVNYKGSFTVELYPMERDFMEYPSDVSLEGNIINVPNGSIVNGMGGFNMSSDKKGFFLAAGYSHVKNVKDDEGNLLRENNTEKRGVTGMSGHPDPTGESGDLGVDGRNFEILDKYTEFEITLGDEDYEYVKMQACIIDEADEGFDRLSKVTGIDNDYLGSIRVSNKPNTLIVGIYKGCSVPTNNQNIYKLTD